MAYVHDDDDESELHDREFPDEDDNADEVEEAGGAETVPCPFCREPVYEDADICPHCRNFVALDEVPTAPGRPWWYWAGLIGAFVVASLWALFG